MRPDEYEVLDGLEVASVLRAGEASAREVMSCAISIAAQRDGALNALCYERFADALDRAAAAELLGAFGAVPFLLKDSSLASKVLPTSIGSRLFNDISFQYDSTLVERFDAAGLIPFARTTVPELCMAPTTEAVRNGGPTRNPWDRTRSSGGSSGGAAVAVAVGMVPLAHGSDGGGSIRIPASCCGVYGLKPSRGLVPMGPSRGEGWGGLAVDGVLSRSVRDTAASLDAVAGYEPGAPYAAPAKPASFLDLIGREPPAGLRVAQWTSAFDNVPIAPECLAAVEKAGQLLTKAGYEVVEAPLPKIDYAGFLSALIQVLAANAASSVRGIVKDRPAAEWRDQLEPAIFDAYERGCRLSSDDYIRAIALFHSVGRRLDRYMAAYDLVLTPTLTQPPAPLGEHTTDTDFVSFRTKVGKYTTFLAIINASGQPAASVPIHWTDAGLPIGVQLIGRFGREDRVLEASAALERLAPWKDRRPFLD